MEKRDIFISYKSEEEDYALWMCSKLEAEGFRCWIAAKDLHGGEDYADRIPPAIKNCRYFLILISNACMRSRWIPKELDIAINHDKHILPFLIEPCKLKNRFELYLSNIQYYCGYLGRETQLKNMIADMRGASGAPGETPAPTFPKVTFPSLHKNTVRIAVAVLALMLTLALGSRFVDLLTLKPIDVFSDIHVSIEGAAPYAKISVTSTSAEPFIRNIYFSVTPDDNLNPGDTVTITANVSKEDAREYGYRLKDNTMEYTLTELESYISNPDILLPDDVEAIREKATQFITGRMAGYPKIQFHDGTEIDLNVDDLANCMTGLQFLEEGYVSLSEDVLTTEAVLIVPFSIDLEGVQYTWYKNDYYEDPLVKDYINYFGYLRFTGLKLDPNGMLIREGSFGIEMSDLFQDRSDMENHIHKRYPGSLVSGKFQGE